LSCSYFLGLRENYISITSPAVQNEGTSAAQDLSAHTILWFTRRAALRLREKEEIDVYEPAIRFPAATEDSEARKALITEASNYLEILLPKLDELIKSLAPATTSKLLMETFLEALQAIPVRSLASIFSIRDLTILPGNERLEGCNGPSACQDDRPCGIPLWANVASRGQSVG
jgi:hypothetical protein